MEAHADTYYVYLDLQISSYFQILHILNQYTCSHDPVFACHVPIFEPTCIQPTGGTDGINLGTININMLSESCK